MTITLITIGILSGFFFGYFVGEIKGRTKEFELWQRLAKKGKLVMEDQQKLIDRQHRLLSVQQRLFDVAPKLIKSEVIKDNVVPFKPANTTATPPNETV